MRETEIASFRMAAFTVGRRLPRNWCGTTCSTFLFSSEFSFFHWFVGISFVFCGLLYSSAFSYYTFVRLDFSFFPFYSSPSILRHAEMYSGVKTCSTFFPHFPDFFFKKFILIPKPTRLNLARHWRGLGPWKLTKISTKFTTTNRWETTHSTLGAKKKSVYPQADSLS